MRGYISLKSYNKDGNLGINLKVFETIAYQTLNDIKGIIAIISIFCAAA